MNLTANVTKDFDNQGYDAITLSILWSRLLAIVDEAATTLQRTAFSTVARESNDFAVVLMDRYGRSIAQSSISVPSFLGVIPLLTKALLADYFPPESLRPGDVAITNDPWLCAGHKPDIGIVTPIFKGDRLVAFIGSISHSPDIGGALWGAGARDLYEEGLMIPPSKLFNAGTLDQTLFNILAANVRTPEQTIGDIRAQVAANDQGARALLSLMEELDLATIDDLAYQVQKVSEKAMREAIASAPDGKYFYEYVADGDGLEEPMVIRLTITIDGDAISADYTGTSGRHSLALNAVINYTYSYTAYPIKCVFSPSVPNNEGSFRPITVTAPRGSLLNAQPPAPLGARHVTGNLLHASVFGALSQAVPDRVQADCGSPGWTVLLNGPRFGRKREANFVEIFFLNGGYGARPTQDGPNILSFPTNISNVPIEVIENDAPILYLEKSLRPDSGGAGKYRGGLGQTVSFKMIGNEPINISLILDKIKTRAQGVCGGQPGEEGSLQLEPPRAIAPKGQTKLYPGDILTLHLPGGGGYGNPLERDPKRMQDDLDKGYITKRYDALP